MLLTLLALTACRPDTSNPSTDSGTELTTVSGGPTWAQDVAPIVAGHCVGCHTAGGIAPFALDNYTTAHAMALNMATQVDNGKMPPWSAISTDECTPRFPFVNDPRLTSEEKAILRTWADNGAPEGDESAAAELPAPVSYDLSGVTNSTVATAFSASGDQDEFECFVLDPKITKDSWMTGLQVVPGNRSVVHHALIFGADASTLDGHKVGDVYPCFGGAGLSNISLVGAWVPGAMPLETPEGVGMPMKAGSLLVMQIHYHPLGAADLSPDATTVDLRLTQTAPAHTGSLDLVGNFDGSDNTFGHGLVADPDDRSSKPEFRIPAGNADHTEKMFYTLPGGFGKARIWGIATHMHYVGVSEMIQVKHKNPIGDEPETECLLDTPNWDFNWQRIYRTDVPVEESVEVRGGDTLVLTCHYDNSLDNAAVVSALEQQGLSEPRDVVLGETTLDEMCLGAFGSASE